MHWPKTSSFAAGNSLCFLFSLSLSLSLFCSPFHSFFLLFYFSSPFFPPRSLRSLIFALSFYLYYSSPRSLVLHFLFTLRFHLPSLPAPRNSRGSYSYANRFPPVGTVHARRVQCRIKRRDLCSERAKGEGKRVRPLFYPGLIALLRSFIFKSTPCYPDDSADISR